MLPLTGLFWKRKPFSYGISNSWLFSCLLTRPKLHSLAPRACRKGASPPPSASPPLPPAQAGRTGRLAAAGRPDLQAPGHDLPCAPTSCFTAYLPTCSFRAPGTMSNVSVSSLLTAHPARLPRPDSSPCMVCLCRDPRSATLALRRLLGSENSPGPPKDWARLSPFCLTYLSVPEICTSNFLLSAPGPTLYLSSTHTCSGHRSRLEGLWSGLVRPQ